MVASSVRPVRTGGRDYEAQVPGREGDERKKKEKKMKEDEVEMEAYKELLKALEIAEEKRKVWSWGRVIIVVLEVFVLSGLTAALACTLTLDNMKHSKLRGLRMWQYAMLSIAVFSGISIIRFLTLIVFWVVTHFGWKLHRDLGYFLKEMKRSIDVTVWFCSILFLWYVWFRPRLRHVYGNLSEIGSHQLTRFLIATCLGAVLWVGKNALFCWMEADLHYRKLCNRITRTIRQMHVLRILHLLLLESTKEDMIKLRKEGDSICRMLLIVKKDKVPVRILWHLCKEYTNQIKNNPLLIDKEIVQDPEKLTDKALDLFASIKNKTDRHHLTPDDDEVSISELELRFHAVNDMDREDMKLFFKAISGELPEDKQFFFKPISRENQDNETEKKTNIFSRLSKRVNMFGIMEAFSFFFLEKNEAFSLNGAICNLRRKKKSSREMKYNHSGKPFEKIERDDFVSWAVVAYRNCWGLQSTLESSEKIIIKLNRVMIVFVLILALIIWLLLSQIVDSAQIALLFSPLLAAKFIFSESTKNMFDGLIFALAMHPFSPGDRVIIKEMELLVTKIEILSTTLYKYQTGEELVYPNSELATIQIINLENNPDQSDHLEFIIEKSTQLEEIKDLEIQIQMSLNERFDAFKTKVVKTEMGLESIKMITHFNYVGSYLTSQVKAVNKSDMLSTIMQLSKKMKASNKKAYPLASHPYFVDFILSNKLKQKHLDIIKTAVTESVEDNCNDNDSKVVLSSVTEKKVRVILYVWKKKEQKPTKLIPRETLDNISSKILEHIRTQDKEHLEENSSSKSGLEVTQVNIQPMHGIAEIKFDGNNVDMTKVEALENAIERHLCEKYDPDEYEVEFEVEINIRNDVLEILAWKQRQHNIEKEEPQRDKEQSQDNTDKEKPQLDMEQIIRDIKNLKEFKDISK